MAQQNLSNFIRKGSTWQIETLLDKAIIGDLIAMYNKVTGLKAKMTPTNIYRGICFLAKNPNLNSAFDYVDNLDPKEAKGFKEDLGKYKGSNAIAIIGGVTALLSTVYDDETGETVGKHFFGVDFNFEKKDDKPTPKKDSTPEPAPTPKKKVLSFTELSKTKSYTNDERLEIILNQKLNAPVYSRDGLAIDRYKSVYLKGEAGCGKTQSVFEYADKYNLEVVQIPKCEFVEQLLGSIRLDGTFTETKLAQALKGEKKKGYTNQVTGRTYSTEGIVVLIDECDTFGPSALVAINNLISQGIVTINEEEVTVPENFRIVCCGNTTGFGATETYGARSPIDGSFMDRLAYIEYSYDKDVENKIVDRFQDRLENPRIVTEFYRDLRNAKILNDTNWILSYRGIENFCNDLIAFESIEEALKSSVLKGIAEEPDALSQIIGKMKKRENPIFKVFQKLVNDLM